MQTSSDLPNFFCASPKKGLYTTFLSVSFFFATSGTWSQGENSFCTHLKMNQKVERAAKQILAKVFLLHINEKWKHTTISHRGFFRCTQFFGG